MPSLHPKKSNISSGLDFLSRQQIGAKKLSLGIVLPFSEYGLHFHYLPSLNLRTRMPIRDGDLDSKEILESKYR
jgi:hypothetical protein